VRERRSDGNPAETAYVLYLLVAVGVGIERRQLF